MRQMMSKLWADDRGVLEAMEFLLTTSILVLGLAVGLTAVRNAITTELEELANAILAISQSFSVGGLSGCCASVQGSQAIDTPGRLVIPHLCTPPIPSLVDVMACP
jgi:hypothetical protein